MFTLTPVIASHIEDTLSDGNKIQEWVTAFGSPLNLIYPKTVVSNIERFQEVFESHKIKGEIFYAYKANKSVAILKQLAVSNAKIDVASEKQLQKALSAGVVGQRIEATGPKNASFIRLALLQGVVLNVNSPQEVETIVALRQELKITGATPVFIRLKEFKSGKIDIVQKDTKFGLSIEEARKAIEKLKNSKDLEFYGFSFHLSTISEQERVVAIEQSLALTLEAIKAGLTPRGINIGGGFSANFLKNEKEWHEYVSAIKDSLINPNKPSMSWNQSGMGYWAERGKIRGSAKFSDFYRSYDQFQELDKVLSSKTPSFGIIGQFLQENMLTLFIEPGRSLLDQVGITLAKVVSINKSLKGETVVFLDMNRSHINSIELEFMSDPVVISTKEKIKPATDGVFLSGNLCLPHDFICGRKVFFKQELEPGDILAFINTAGYFMDFTESETIQHPMAHKIAIDSSTWFVDEKYEPKFN
ncbi:MAG: Diaminopimelate decarboxylase [candidate division WS2 bacterium]|nr:Diaminopimelate decarboxylase [Candidatus Lithacetigena glycinireducens]MBT9175161.1 Diaminopimelate decarboxylase [Candidatus Lithacetigena glycinireducens]